MQLKIKCSITEMTNGFLDNLSFMIECDITIFINDKSFDIPFDSDSHEILLNDSDLPDEIKQKLSKDDN